MHEGLKRIEATKGRGREWESTAEKQQVIVKERDKGGGKSHKMFDGRKLAQELQQLTEEMNRELTTKRRIKITRLPYNVEEKVRSSSDVCVWGGGGEGGGAFLGAEPSCGYALD